MKYDLHVHSKYSYDSLLEPKNIIKIARKRGLQGIAITDHNTIRGGTEAKKISGGTGLEVIVGSEIRTEFGDLIGLFLNEEIAPGRFSEVIELIKKQGGVSILAHPYRQYKHPELLAGQTDAVEIYNSRSRPRDNEQAKKLAGHLKVPVSAGSDAHTGFEIGKGLLVTDGALERDFKNTLSGKARFEGSTNNYYLSHGLSLLTEKSIGGLKKFSLDKSGRNAT